ncbi:MAG: hypothetical protein JXR94_09970 [Candidatus Hydrogenedentes bacterium]|nr:hypothetical protein [Candidatus Hydrogenedentota bacterium]
MNCVLLISLTAAGGPQHDGPAGAYLAIRGIYPHLAAFNHPVAGESGDPNRHGECGIGAVVPWADHLWYLTYPPHMRSGSNDKLYQVDAGLNRTIRPESVGGTHACRLIHRESNQLIIGPYFIGAGGTVRCADIGQLEGRMTAVARHLADPENLVYFYDMEGTVYEVNVHTLAVHKLFDKPVPGWHGKGAYTAQGRLVVANNGEAAARQRSYDTLEVGGPAEGEEAGVLAEWDGATWRIVERKQFTDITGPGGIAGSPDDESPLWSMGWDRRSVILKVLDGGAWSTFRVPKGSYTFDPRHGWYTEWPRIREVAPGQLMMVMHGTLFAFPKTFSAGNRAGLRPIATHLRYIPDFCHWNGRVVLASDDTSLMHNPPAGQPQSNLWFGTFDELAAFGPRAGWGGVWRGDEVRAGEPSDPFLVNGYARWCLHLAHDAGEDTAFSIEADADGLGNWTGLTQVRVPAAGYAVYVAPAENEAQWIRVVPEADCTATAYLHLGSPRSAGGEDGALFAALADMRAAEDTVGGLIRPAQHNRGLQFLARGAAGGGAAGGERYIEVTLRDDGTGLEFRTPESRAEEVRAAAAIEPFFEVDDASVIVRGPDGARYRLPKGDPAFDGPPAPGGRRALRECVSERYLANMHGTFYEIPRADDGHSPDVVRIKPVASHTKAIVDFCTWRGLLVLSGTRAGARPDGEYFGTEDGWGLWFGSIDDLWRLGKPVGRGGPWAKTAVKAGVPSDPYLMTGYDRKRLTLSHAGDAAIRFTVEINFDQGSWVDYEEVEVAPGTPAEVEFPEGFGAHWVRLRADGDCVATAEFRYE